MNQQNGFALFGAIVVHLFAGVDDSGTGTEWNRAVGIKLLAAPHPPGAGEYRDVAVVLMEMRPAHVAGFPFIEVGIGARLGGVAIERRVGGGAGRIVFPLNLVQRDITHRGRIERDARGGGAPADEDEGGGHEQANE